MTLTADETFVRFDIVNLIRFKYLDHVDETGSLFHPWRLTPPYEIIESIVLDVTRRYRRKLFVMRSLEK